MKKMESLKRIGSYILLGIAVTGVLITLKILLEHTSVRYQTELSMLEVLRSVRTVFSPNAELPVVVVDVSEIKEKKQQLADLEKLKETIEAIAAQKPSAIAVALDLTPKINDSPDQDNSGENADLQAKDYFAFLDFCLALKAEKKIPIFLAVGSRTGGKPEEWLGQEKYKELAATVLQKDGDASRILVWFKVAQSEKLFSLSASLAQAYQKPELPNSMSWAISSIEEDLPGTEQHLGADIAYADAIMSYSKLAEIQQNRVLTISKTSIREMGTKFRYKMVLLGDNKLDEAAFTPPGQSDPQPGVYLHACAAYTFARDPLYEIKPTVRFALDLSFTFLVFGLVGISRYPNAGDSDLPLHSRKRRAFFVQALATVILLAATVLVSSLGLLWLDFLLVAVALWLLPLLARTIPSLSELQLVQGESRVIGEAEQSLKKVDNKQTILFLAANPTDDAWLETDKEHRVIKAEIERGKHRDVFEFLQPQFAVTITELLRALNAKPKIVHFSGHGKIKGITITNEDNESQLLNNEILERLFKPLTGFTEMIVLNSCYSAHQAKSISRFGILVVGNNLPIRDTAAISFARGLYNALGEGKSFADAINDARIVVMTETPRDKVVLEIWQDGIKQQL